MDIYRHRPLALLAPALLLAAVACSPAGDGTTVAVPTPDAKTAPVCRNLDRVLPRKVDGLNRHDPEPRSVYTAGWGPAIILRCGIVRPPKMVDPKVALGQDPDAMGGGVNGVDWLMEKESDGSWRFTTSERRAYVQVTLSKELSGPDDSAQVLMDLAPAVKKAVPEGLASMRH